MSEKGFTDRDVLQANQQLLTAITDGDYETYLDLMSPDLVAIEPESKNLPVQAVAAERDSAEEDRGVKGPPVPSSTSPLRVLNQTFKHLKDGNRLPSSDRTSRHPIAIVEGLTYIALTAARDGDL